MTDTTHVGFSDQHAQVDTTGQTEGTPSAGPSSSAAPAASDAALDYTYVRMPDGSIQAVLTSAIVDATHGTGQVPTDVSEAPKASAAPVPERQFYVWLADGQVKRVKESDLPGTGGTNAEFGHWVTDGKAYLIVGIYPVEDNTK